MVHLQIESADHETLNFRLWALTVIFMKIFAILTISTAILFAIASYFIKYKIEYTVSVINRSTEKVVLKKILINNSVISSESVTLKPILDKYFPVESYIKSFNANDPKIFELEFESVHTEKNIILSCQVEDKNLSGCLFKIGFINENKINCVCDPYSDFSN